MRGGDPRLPARPHAARLNFFADPTTLTASRVPPSEGQRIDLSYRGESYRLHVYAIGSWRYRVHLDGRVVAATLREEGRARGALSRSASRSLRLLYDPTEAGLRVEIEGRPAPLRLAGARARCAPARPRWWSRST